MGRGQQAEGPGGVTVMRGLLGRPVPGGSKKSLDYPLSDGKSLRLDVEERWFSEAFREHPDAEHAYIATVTVVHEDGTETADRADPVHGIADVKLVVDDVFDDLISIVDAADREMLDQSRMIEDLKAAMPILFR